MTLCCGSNMLSTWLVVRYPHPSGERKARSVLARVMVATFSVTAAPAMEHRFFEELFVALLDEAIENPVGVVG